MERSTEQSRLASRFIGGQIRLHRRRLGWTQEKLAEEADMHRTSIAGIENGKAALGTWGLIRIAVALGCMPGDLIPAEAVALPALARTEAGAETAGGRRPARRQADT